MWDKSSQCYPRGHYDVSTSASGCVSYPSFKAASKACMVTPTCNAVTKLGGSNHFYELRSSKSLSKSPMKETSWLKKCFDRCPTTGYRKIRFGFDDICVGYRARIVLSEAQCLKLCNYDQRCKYVPFWTNGMNAKAKTRIGYCAVCL